MIFVFGSNRSGIHGAGAAKYAHEMLGAEWGVGEGPTGECYALPTKGFKIEKLTVLDIEPHIKTFIDYAANNLDQDFKVTQVGCGLGGFTAHDIAPLFRRNLTEPQPNLYFDTAWHNHFGFGTKYWGTHG